MLPLRVPLFSQSSHHAQMQHFLLSINPIFRLFDRTLARRSHLFFQIELDDFDGALPVLKYSLSAGSS
jgi:hypothetical protein